MKNITKLISMSLVLSITLSNLSIPVLAYEDGDALIQAEVSKTDLLSTSTPDYINAATTDESSSSTIIIEEEAVPVVDNDIEPSSPIDNESATTTEEVSSPTPTVSIIATTTDETSFSTIIVAPEATSTDNDIELSSSTKDISIIIKKEISLDEFEKNDVVNKDYVQGEILVKYKNTKINLDTSIGKAAALNFANSKSLEKKEDLVKNNISVLKINDAKTVEQKVEELKSDPDVEYAQPNFQYYPMTISSNDTHKSNLWGLDNTGQIVNSITGTSDADIDAPEAWAINEGTNASVVVAVIDSGVAYNHPDLFGNMWNGANCVSDTNTALGGCNYGYDFGDSDKTPLPNDLHGTHVAGIIASLKNNSRGIIGVAPNAKIMAIKSSLTTVENVRAINFAKYNGARIINASWGQYGTANNDVYDVALYNAIRDFQGLFVAAAGNGGFNHDDGVDSHKLFPSYYKNTTSIGAGLDNIISVAATDQNDALATFSDYGVNSVDVGAPGANIHSLIPQETVFSSQDFEAMTPPAMPSGWITGGTNNHWGTYNRTSSWGPSWGTVLYGDINPTYESNSNSIARSPLYNLSTVSGANINFSTACDTEYNPSSWTDYMALELSSNGGSSFTQVLKWDEPYIDSDTNPSGSAPYNFTVNIPSQYFTSNFKFQFRWVTNGNTDAGSYGDGCAINNITINKFSDGSDEQYGYSDGTSMATPHVAGLAALILGYKPELTYLEAKDVILTTGDSLVSLSGKTVTGKRINALNAIRSLDSAAPVITLNGPSVVYMQLGDTYAEEGASALDAVDGTVEVVITGSVNSALSGVYTITYTATDAVGNVGSMTRTVNVVEDVNVVKRPVYRFLNLQTGDHFFTIDQNERDWLVNNYSWLWQGEGTSYYTYNNQQSSTTPVYRFLNLTNGQHFFTTDQNERDWLIANYSWLWQGEGSSFYAYTSQQSSTTPVYRFLNLTNGQHFFTTDQNERDWLIANYSWLWQGEGTAWYVPVIN